MGTEIVNQTPVRLGQAAAQLRIVRPQGAEQQLRPVQKLNLVGPGLAVHFRLLSHAEGQLRRADTQAVLEIDQKQLVPGRAQESGYVPQAEAVIVDWKKRYDYPHSLIPRGSALLSCQIRNTDVGEVQA